MEAATNRTLAVDNMTGDACVQKVTATLKGVQGVTTHHVKVGSAKINADQGACDAACGALGVAGHPARENPAKPAHDAGTQYKGGDPADTKNNNAKGGDRPAGTPPVKAPALAGAPAATHK